MHARTLILALLLITELGFAQGWKMVVDFRGQWKFKVGDNSRWAEVKTDDSKWDEIFAPANWEDEGYPGYDGYGWYRKHFRVSSEFRSRPLYIYMGFVDDVSEVYINGHFVSFSGSFPPDYQTAYNIDQRFSVPKEYLNFSDDNVIAVRVYDSELSGGITRGKPGLYEMKDYLYPDFAISGTWKLHRGDDMEWITPSFDDSDWKTVIVPALWETQGLKHYDGYAWYRIRFTVSQTMKQENVVLLLGKIDDIDETYLNGERIGRTGRRPVKGDEYQKLRAYTIPSGTIKYGQENVLAVRVYDNFRHGGIYDGPIGFTTSDRYREWETKHRPRQRDNWNFFEELFGR